MYGSIIRVIMNHKLYQTVDTVMSVVLYYVKLVVMNYRKQVCRLSATIRSHYTIIRNF